MRGRSGREKDVAFHHYGGRGITVCPEWNDFTVFLTDMGMKPGPHHDLDRIDNDKGYYKDNCRWATRAANLNNRRTNNYVEFGGRRQTVTQWAVELGIKGRTLSNRLQRGWTVDRAFKTPTQGV